MHAVRDAMIYGQDRRPLLVREQDRATNRTIFLLYVLLLGGAAIHLYRKPMYSMDSIQYMGNALLMEERDPVEIHRRVYAALRESVPPKERADLLGYEAGAPEAQNKSRQERAANAYRFAEFLPLFAIRPLYNQALWLVSKTGLGLVPSGILISAGSYFLMGILVFIWFRRYASPTFTLVASILLMISPPLMDLGRDLTADALATLIAFMALYLIFEGQQFATGITLLLAAIYFRTDFLVLAGPVILACWLERRIDFWKAGVLAALAVASVLCINHFAGDYGLKMLYYRNFVSVPTAPGEMTVQFSGKDYVSAFRSGLTLAANSFLLPFLLLGTIGVFLNRRMLALYMVAVSYLCLHFILLPNWQERWFGLFYLTMGVCAVGAAWTRTSRMRPSSG
jgi:hypothetical protein